MKPPRVLIVDDNPMNLELTMFLLGAAGFALDSATDAVGAAVQIMVSRPDLILMDIQLPIMDGLAFTQQLKADPKTQQIVVVAFTSYAMRGDEARMRAAGCDGYIAKPIDIASFAAKVRSYIPTVSSETTAA